MIFSHFFYELSNDDDTNVFSHTTTSDLYFPLPEENFNRFPVKGSCEEPPEKNFHEVSSVKCLLVPPEEDFTVDQGGLCEPLEFTLVSQLFYHVFKI